MKKSSVLRKGLTFGADSLGIIAGSILCAFTYHPGASFFGVLLSFQAFIPMLLITMALISIIMKTYDDSISENVTSAMILSIGAFAIAFALSVLFLLLTSIERQDPIVLINLFIYSAFFIESYRLVFALRLAAGRWSGKKRQMSPAGMPGKQGVNEIPIEELLGRAAVRQDLQSVSSYIAGKTVFVSGGAGAIGFELCSQLLSYNAKRVVIFDLNENKLLETQTELSLRYPKTQFVACIGSIQDRARLREVFNLYRPQIVFHSAAYKHVPMMEANPQEALKNNVMGTLYMVEAAIKHRVDRFILLSTDMAAGPTDIMGATKRVAEMLIQRANTWSSTRFSAVRFGTSIAVRGSIMQLLNKQIESGGPVYITDKNNTKYLMTISEAVQLIMETGALAEGGEIFMLDMGEPVNICELAKSMIRNAGFKPEKDIKIVITGVHTAENNFNEISLPEATGTNTLNERIRVLKTNEDPPVTFEAEFDKLCQSIDTRDYGSAFNKIGVLVPTFQNSSL